MTIDHRMILAGRTAQPASNFMAGRNEGNALRLQQAELDRVPLQNELANLQLTEQKNSLSEQAQLQEMRSDAIDALRTKRLLDKNPMEAAGFVRERLSRLSGDTSGEQAVLRAIDEGRLNDAHGMLDSVLEVARMTGVIDADSSMKDAMERVNLTLKLQGEGRAQEAHDAKMREAAAKAEAKQQELKSEEDAVRLAKEAAKEKISLLKEVLADEDMLDNISGFEGRVPDALRSPSFLSYERKIGSIIAEETLKKTGMLKGAISEKELDVARNAATTFLRGGDFESNRAALRTMLNAFERGLGMEMSVFDEPEKKQPSGQSRRTRRRGGTNNIDSLVNKYAD